MSRFAFSSVSSSSAASPATTNAEFLLSLSAPPDRSGPRTAPDEAELLIDPQFYSFLSGVTVVLLLFSFSYVIAYLTLSTVRKRQYRKYRRKRKTNEERHRLALPHSNASSALTTASPGPSPLRSTTSPSLSTPPLFVPALRPFSSSYALPLSTHSSPSFLSHRRSLPAILRPVASALAAASSSSPSQLPRLSLPFTSPAVISEYLLSIVSPRSRPRSTASFYLPSFLSPAPHTNGSHHPSSRAHPPPTPSPSIHTPSSRSSASVPPSEESLDRAAQSFVLSSSQQDELDAQQFEHNRGFLSFSLSTFLLTIALLWMSLLSLTLTLSTPSLASHWLLTWLTTPLVSSLWTLVSLLTSLSLFLVAPFAYLYYEAEGLLFLPFPTFTSTSRHAGDDDEADSFLPRFIETIVVLSFFSVMLYGSFQLLHSIIYRLPLLALTWRWSVLDSLWSLTSLPFSFTASLSSFFTPAVLSNVMHFIPGLLICLLHFHSGFSALLSSAFSLRIPFYYRHHLQRQLDRVEVKLTHTRLQLSSSSSHTRRLLLAKRVQGLEAQVKLFDGELRPPLLSLSAFPVLRNGVWFVLSVLCLLLIWHVMVRVMQREARLMMHSIDVLIQEDAVEEGKVRGAMTVVLTVTVSALKWLLHSMKHAINTLLFTLGMIRRRDLIGKEMGHPSSTSLSSSLPSVSFLLHVWSDVLRLFSSFLLGQNGFRLPLSSLLFDLLVADFFCLSCVIGLYRMPLMAPYSPFSSFASTASAAFAQGEREDATALLPLEAGDDASIRPSEQKMQRMNRMPSLPTSSSLIPSSSSPSDPSSALHSAQFFVVNTTVLLLLTSSFPFSLWILGLSSFDLPHFYPSASELSSGLFMHAYNLAFIGLSARQGAAIWSKMLWFLIKTTYSSFHAVTTWILPSLTSSMPSPEALAALPTALLAHPSIAHLSFLLSWPGLYCAMRSACVLVLRVSWVLLLYLMRVLVVGLRLCATNLYLKLSLMIQQELQSHPVPLVNRVEDNSREEGGEEGRRAVRRSVSRLRGMDEERFLASSSSQKEEVASPFSALSPLHEEDKAEVRSTQPHLSQNGFSPPLPSSSPSLPRSRSFAPTPAPVNGSSSFVSSTLPLVAPRPLHFAVSASLDALNTDVPTYEDLPQRSSKQSLMVRMSSSDSSSPPPRRSSSVSSPPASSPTWQTSPSLSSSPVSGPSHSPSSSPSPLTLSRPPPTSPTTSSTSRRKRRGVAS